MGLFQGDVRNTNTQSQNNLYMQMKVLGIQDILVLYWISTDIRTSMLISYFLRRLRFHCCLLTITESYINNLIMP